MGKSKRQRSRQPAVVPGSSSHPVQDPVEKGDIVIPVIGPVGVGKSTFINNILSFSKAEVGDGSNPCTSGLDDYCVSVPNHLGKQYDATGYRLVLVDTPGFDNENLKDTDVVDQIAQWLASSYPTGTKIGGAVYIYPIYHDHITRNNCSNVKVFEKISGHDGFSCIVIAATNWGPSSVDSGHGLEDELQLSFSPDGHTLPGRVPILQSLSQDISSAWAVLEWILHRLHHKKVDAAIFSAQEQLVEKGLRRYFRETSSIRELRRELDELTARSGVGPASHRMQKLNELIKQTNTGNPRSAGQKKTSIMPNLMRPGDTCMPSNLVRKDDIVIPVMGPTGSGKSTFINNLLPSPIAAVSDGFKSCTSQLDHYFVDIPSKVAEEYGVMGRRLILVDTPGFDDTNLSDSEILRRIAVWLASSYNADMKVGGVVYMYPIYPNRITRSDRSNVKIFQKLCGEGSLSKIILATTRWDICPPASGEAREDALRTKFWAAMLDEVDEGKAALMARLTNEKKSAWSLIGLILSRLRDKELEGVVLDVQRQLIDKKKIVPETSAARELRQKLEDLLKESRSGNTEARKQRIQALVQQAKELNVPISRRIMSVLGL